MLENGHTFGAYEVVETELIMRNKLARGAYGPPPMVSEVGPALWLRATTAQRDAMLAEIEAMPEGEHIIYKPSMDKPSPDNLHIQNCPCCVIRKFKAKIKERFNA